MCHGFRKLKKKKLLNNPRMVLCNELVRYRKPGLNKHKGAKAYIYDSRFFLLLLYLEGIIEITIICIIRLIA